jgi:hypothetical protein
MGPVSVPEKTLEHWSSQYLNSRYSTNVALWLALDAGVPAAWVAGDEVYGADSKLRIALQQRAIGHVLAVACDRQITTGAGKHPAKMLARRLPARAWSSGGPRGTAGPSSPCLPTRSSP